jgi:hypothetical protein
MAEGLSAPLINGVRPSFADIILRLHTSDMDDSLVNAIGQQLVGAVLPSPVKGFKSISYNDGMEPQLVYGASVLPVGRTRGQYKAEGSIELYLEDFDILSDYIIADGEGLYEVAFDLSLNFATASTSALKKRELIGCRITKATEDHSGTDAATVKCDLSMMFIVRDGKLPVFDLGQLALGSINVR